MKFGKSIERYLIKQQERNLLKHTNSMSINVIMTNYYLRNKIVKNTTSHTYFNRMYKQYDYVYTVLAKHVIVTKPNAEM